MISKAEFVLRISVGEPLSAQKSTEIESQFDSASEAAQTVERGMPSIGFFSVQKRLNVFFAVCRHLDQLIESGRITIGESQLALMVLRVSNKPFSKAISMFDIRGERFDARARAEMPRSAQEYLAGLRRYG